MKSLRRGHKKLVAEILLEAGADVNTTNKEGKTPLHVAATWDKKLIAEILLEAGADVHFKDKEGKTPLDIAKNRKVFRVLWSFGAS